MAQQHLICWLIFSLRSNTTLYSFFTALGHRPIFTILVFFFHFIFLSKVKHFALAVIEFYFVNYRLFLKVIMITWTLMLSSKTPASLPRMLSSANCVRVCSISPGNSATRTSNHSGIGADLSAPNYLGGRKWIIYKSSWAWLFQAVVLSTL